MSVKCDSRLKHKRNSGEQWASNNRILSSFGYPVSHKYRKLIARNPNFDTEETKLLIQLWGDPKVQRTLITTHKKHAVICQLAAKMQESGYMRSPDEITTRIKNLKCFYNRLKKEVDAGECSPSELTWKHFAEMDAIMTRPIFSVRPNEIPLPSLSYRKEQERQERKERRRNTTAEDGGLDSSSDDEDDDIEDLIAMNKTNSSNCSNDSSQDRAEINDDDESILAEAALHIDSSNDETLAAFANTANNNKMCSDDNHLAASNDSYDSNSKDLEIKEEFECQDVILTGVAMNAEQSKKPKANLKKTVKRVLVADPTEPNSSFEIIEDISSTSVVTPKFEPIDLVDDDDDDDNEKILPITSAAAKMPTLVDMLKMSNGNISIANSSAAILIPTSSITTTANRGAPSSISDGCNTTATLSQPTATPGKISLVPTNFLMQPKPAGTQQLQQPTMATMPVPQFHLVPNTASQVPQRIFLSNSSQVGNKFTATPSGIVTTGPGGMKVLLVNAEQSTAGTNLGLSNALSTVLGATNVLIQQPTITKPQQQQQQQQQQQPQQLLQQQPQPQPVLLQHQNNPVQQQSQKSQDDSETKRSERKRKLVVDEKKSSAQEPQNKNENLATRMLMHQLLTAQAENNELGRQRLILERKRFEYEKSVGERLLNLLPTLIDKLDKHQQQPSTQYQQQQPTPTQVCINPPKLVFTSSKNPPTVITVGNASTTTATENASTSTTFPLLAATLQHAVATTSAITANTGGTKANITTERNNMEYELLIPKLEEDI